jgi:ABC-2 type transport system ATP-binding protein
MAAIEATDVVMDFGGMKALDHVGIKVERGDFFGFFGSNGAGKTTLIRIMTGQLEPTSGSVRVLDVDVVKEPLRVKELVGIVPEVESPPTYLTAYEYMYFVGKVRGIDSLDDRIDKWLTFFDLESKKGTICKDMSKGMRQKLMLASAFIHEPKLLFLDEPFINLDPIYQRKLREYLQGLREEGRTIFLNSHLLEIAQRLCQDVIVLHRGRLVAKEDMGSMRARGEDLEALFMRLVGGEDARPA